MPRRRRARSRHDIAQRLAGSRIDNSGDQEGVAHLTDPSEPSGWPYPRRVAHRCGGTLAPENTLAGFDACIGHGYRMVEFDAKLSADNEVFLLHDDTLDRTTNGHGAAAQRSWRELSKLDAGTWYAPRFACVRLPLLADAASRCARDGLFANLEIKPCPGRDALTGRLVATAALVLWRTQTPPLLSSFSLVALEAARAAAPALPRGVLFGNLPDNWLDIAQKLGCVSVHADHTHLSAHQVAAIHAAGLRVLTYTVNDAARARELLDWGVDMICTDRLDIVGP
jgi:glycerophosphoryl diester phosphodiesterase